MKTFLIACILFMSVALVYRATSDTAKPDAVPSTIDAMGQKDSDRINALADKMNNLHTLQHKWTDEEWKVMLLQNQMTVGKLTAAFFEVELCKTTKQGYYCDQALSDLKQLEYELDKLEKAVKDADDIAI